MILGVTGKNGLLGSAFVEDALAHGFTAQSIPRSVYQELDIQLIVCFLKNNRINVLVHCGAETDVERCEKEPDHAYLSNVIITEVLVVACRIAGVKFVYISSTGIYGTSKETPYREYDEPMPTTVHHNTKFLGEKVVAVQSQDFLIVRTGWLFGGAESMRKNFVVNRIREALASDGFVYSDATQRGNPTFVRTLTKQIFHILEKSHSGIFNAVSSLPCSRFDYVCAILRAANINIEVKPVDAAQFNRIARVSRNETAENYKLRLMGLDLMGEWQEDLISYVNGIKVEDL